MHIKFVHIHLKHIPGIFSFYSVRENKGLVVNIAEACFHCLIPLLIWNQNLENMLHVSIGLLSHHIVFIFYIVHSAIYTCIIYTTSDFTLILVFIHTASILRPVQK